MSDAWPAEPDLRSRLYAVFAHASGVPSPTLPWQGATYRFASLQYADKDRFTNGEGARKSGGRFSPVGGPRTLYLSLDRATAVAELDSWYEYYGVPDTAFKPRLLAAVAVSVGAILDLTSPEVLGHLGLSAAHLVEEWRGLSDTGGVAPTQVFGRLTYEVGFEGLYTPSVRRPGGFNLALFPDNFRDGTHTLMLTGETG